MLKVKQDLVYYSRLMIYKKENEVKQDERTIAAMDKETHNKLKLLAEKKGMKLYRLIKDIVDYYIKHEKISLDK